MANALVIKDANFSANKVTTVTFVIPCTGISFSSSSVTLTGYSGVPVSYTLTPENTSDPVTWSSSDTDVFTVADGVLTAVGMGTATLTATCNGHTATATVTVDIAYIVNALWTSIDVVNSNYVRYGVDYYRIGLVGATGQKTQYGIYPGTGQTELQYLIQIPKGATKIRLSIDESKKTMLYNSTNTEIFFAKDASCGGIGRLDCALFVSNSLYNLRSDITDTVTIPDGADCFAVNYRFTSQYSPADNPAEVNSTVGFTIKFLTT